MKNSLLSTIPGIALSVLVALLAIGVSSLIASQLISPSVWALFIGLCFHPLLKRYALLSRGVSFTSKRLLRLAIIGMGVTLHFSDVLTIGSISLIVMVCTLATAFVGGYFLGRVIGLDWKQSALINAGTGICGGSAIAALAPVIDAEEGAIAWALSATFIFDVAMVILFPIMGRTLMMSDVGYGLWTGTAVNDTSSVLAAGYAFSEAAGSIAIIVKLTRTLSIVPIALIFSLINRRHTASVSRSRSLFPWFIVAFLVAVLCNTLGLISSSVALGISSFGRFSMVAALAAVGLSTDALSSIRSAFRPMLHGFCISAAVVVVSYAVQAFIGYI